MGRREDAEKMPFEGLDTAFHGVKSFLVGWDVVMDDVGLGGLEEDVTRGRVDRTFALEAVMWPKPVAGAWGLF